MSDPFQVEDSFFQAGGNLLPDSPSYVTREADHELLGLTLAGEYCNVLTARQTGKSSLMVRTRERLHGKSVHTVVIDLSIVGSQEITADEWYFGLVSAIRRQLELGIDERRWWEEREQLSPVQRFSDFLKEVVLRRVPGPIIIFIDEIDSTLSLSFTDDFFVAIRAMYNERARNPENKRLTFVLVGVALPADLIKRRRRTPYNIGQTVDLKDFTSQNASGFLPGLELACPGQSEAILERVLYWTGGHPYLTQRVCVAVVEERGEGWSDERVDQLVVRLFFQEGRIREETNLQWIDDYVRGSKYRGGMLQVYGAIISGQEVRDEERSIEKSQLKLSGLVRATSEGYLQVRNRIYGHVFGPEWVDSARPGIAWSKVVFSALAAMLLIAIAMVAYRYVVDKSSTPTPGPSPSFTTTQAAVIVPTSTPLPSETDTPTSTSTSTATPVDTKITTRVYTDTPTPTGTLSPSSTPKATRTATGTPSPSSTATATPTMPTPTPIVIVVTATPTLAPGLAPPPVLVEPEAGTTFSKVVRLKWNWHRRLEDYERFAIRWEPVSGQTVGDWWVSEGGIIDGGGAIHSVEDGYRFEVNVGLDPYPEGEANWSVAVFQDPSKVQVSQWSERRQIGKGTPTPIVPKPGSYITATTGSAIFVGPDTDSEILGLVGVGESVEVIGRVSWGRWAYVHSDREDVEGFVWGPYFGWHEKEAWESLPIIPTPTPTPTPTFEPLVILRPESMPFCTDDGGKMAGVQVFVQGGDGNYTFFWEDEKVSATELEEAGSYLVFWSWGSFSQVGTLTVVSGDGQRASQGDIWLSEATCSP